MNPSSDNSSSNPYAAPATQEINSADLLPTTHGYQIVGQALHCKQSLNLSDVCWLTGSSDVLLRKKLIKQRIGSRWLTWFSAVMLVLCVLTLFRVFPEAYRRLVPPIFLASIALKYSASFWGTKFELQVGQSQKAANLEKKARRLYWIQIILHPGFVIAALVLTTSARLSLAIVVAWIAGRVAIYFFCNPKTFRPVFRKGTNGTFVVDHLEPEFLQALKQRLADGPGEE